MCEQPTPTIFRKFSDGEVIALFVRELGDFDPYNCLSYVHVGQHGTADLLGNIEMTVPASPVEYAPLLAELQSIGYIISIRQKQSQKDMTIRMEAINGWQQELDSDN